MGCEQVQGGRGRLGIGQGGSLFIGGADLRLHLLFQRLPVQVGQEFLQARQRVALLFALLLGLGLVRLVIDEGMPHQARHAQVEQAGTLAGTHIGDRLGDLLRCLVRVGAVAVEDAQMLEAAQVGGQVRAGGLHVRTDGDGKGVVFDIEEHGDLAGGGDVEGSPKSIGCDGTLAAMRQRDRPVPFLVLERGLVVLNGLRPARGRGVLCAHIAGGGEDGHAALTGRAGEHHAHLAPLGGGTGLRHASRERLAQGQPGGEHERARTVIDRGGVMRVGQLQGKQYLGKFMPLGGKLILDLVGGGKLTLLEFIEAARGQQQVGNASPVGGGGSLWHVLPLIGKWTDFTCKKRAQEPRFLEETGVLIIYGMASWMKSARSDLSASSEGRWMYIMCPAS